MWPGPHRVTGWVHVVGSDARVTGWWDVLWWGRSDVGCVVCWIGVSK